MQSAFYYTTQGIAYEQNFSQPEQHSVWDCHYRCHLRCHPLHPLGLAHQGEEQHLAQGRWTAGWGSAASASAPSTQY